MRTDRSQVCDLLTRFRRARQSFKHLQFEYVKSKKYFFKICIIIFCNVSSFYKIYFISNLADFYTHNCPELTLSDKARCSIANYFHVDTDCAADRLNSVGKQFIDRETNFLLVSDDVISSAGNLYLFFPKSFHISFLMLDRLLKFPNKKALVVSEHFFLVWHEILVPLNFQYIKFKLETDFMKFFPDEGVFKAFVPDCEYYFLYQT